MNVSIGKLFFRTSYSVWTQNLSVCDNNIVIILLNYKEQTENLSFSSFKDF